MELLAIHGAFCTLQGISLTFRIFDKDIIKANYSPSVICFKVLWINGAYM
jgi:hypothetical protein